MRAIILVGGRGTRLQPLTDTRPKPMLPIVGVPFLELQLAHLRRHGVTAVTFACGFLPDQIEAHFGAGDRVGLELSYAVEPEPLDTAGAIAFAARTLDPQRLLVCNGDVLTDTDLTLLLAEHERRGAVATIALTPVDDPSRYGLVRTDADGAVTAFVEKPPPEECDTDLINAGTYVLEAEVVERVPAGVRCNIEREVFPQLVGKGLFAVGFRGGYWNDIGTPASYLAANLDVLDGRVAGVDLGAGPHVADDAVVAPGAELLARVVVGAGASIADGARVGESVVLERARIGEAAVVGGAIIGEDATVAPGAVVSPGTVVAPGAHVA